MLPTQPKKGLFHQENISNGYRNWSQKALMEVRDVGLGAKTNLSHRGEFLHDEEEI